MIRKTLNDTDLKEFKEMLRGATNVVLTCHVRPDGDAIGSTLGMASLLQTLGKNVAVVTPDLPPRSLNFIVHGRKLVAYTQYPDYAATLLNKADLIVCCDFNTPSRLDMLAQLVLDAPAAKVLIDHHRDPDMFAALTFSYPEMSSTCELMFRIIAGMGYYDVLNVEGARCLLTGIITDTRNFTVNCDAVDLFEIMAKLVEKGVDKQQIIREALQLRTLDSVRLQAYAVYEKLEIFEPHRAALICLDAAELERFHYVRGDSEGLVNVPLDIRGVAYSIFMREDPDCIKVSARSVDNFPVSEICKQLYGGGGHIMAAGGEFHGSMAECRRKLIEAMPAFDKYLKTKSND